MMFKRASTNCQCDGGYRTNGHRWRVIERRKAPRTSRLKCLECGWKWWSGCKYVVQLEDHTEASRSGMTDQDVLDRMNAGTLSVLVNEARVFSYHPRLKQWTELEQIHRKGYHFVKICSKGKQKKVAVHRLVWMFANRCLVPEGYDVDHVEGTSSHAIDNLRLLEASENRSGRVVMNAPSEDEVPF